MGVAYKNFWSLNTDEAVVSGILRNEVDKDVEVLMPMNAQMKDVDLVLMNLKTRKTITIQVKGSRAYEPDKRSIEKYGHGNSGWSVLKDSAVFNTTVEYFIFLIYVLEGNASLGRRTLSPHSIVIPTNKLQELTKTNKKIGNRYHYYFWVNPKTKEALEIRDKKYYVSEYLDKAGYAKLNEVVSFNK